MLLLIPIIWICLGVYCIIGTKNRYKSKQKIISVMGVVFMAFGIVGIVGYFFHNDEMEFSGIMIPCALVLIGVPIGIKIQAHSCRFSIYAECVNYSAYSGGKGQKSYAPVFRYTYNQKEYEIQSPISYSKKQIQEKYKTGEPYQVYINPDCPESCIDTKDIPVSYFFVGLAGWAMLGFCIWLLMK